MEFSGMNKTTEEAFSFPNATSHPAHVYNSLHCSPNSEFGEKSISDASPDDHVLRLVDDFNCAYTSTLRDCESFKCPNSRAVSVSVPLSTSVDVPCDEDPLKLPSKVAAAAKIVNDNDANYLHNNNSDPRDVRSNCTDGEIATSGNYHSHSCINVSACNGTVSRPSSASTLSSPVSKPEINSDINGINKQSVPSPFPEADRTKMDLDKLDDTIDYVLAVARSDEPCEGMFVLSCRMREPAQMSSPSLRANTPSSCLITSPTLSPAPSPHSSQISASPMVIQPPKSQSVFSSNNLCNMISPQPVQRYIVDQSHGILHLTTSTNSQCVPTQYSNQTVSFVQLCSDSSNSPVIQATQQLVSQIAQPPTSAHVVFHPGVIHGIQNPTVQTQFTVPHSNISAVSVQRIQNPLLSPVKHNMSNAYNQTPKSDVLSQSTPNRISDHRNGVQITPSSICLVRTPVHSQSLACGNVKTVVSTESINGVKQAVSNPSMSIEKKSQTAATFRQPIVPVQATTSTMPAAHQNMQQGNGHLNAQHEQLSPQVSRKRSHSAVSGNTKRRKTSLNSPSSAVVCKGMCEPNVSPSRLAHSVAQECFEKLKVIDLKSLVSAPSLQPYNLVLPPPCACEFTSALEKDDEISYINRRGVKYLRGPMAVGFPKCFNSSLSSDTVDAYITQHLKTTVPPGPMMHHSNDFSYARFKENSVCASPEPPSFENHMKALFSKMHKFSRKDGVDHPYNHTTQYDSLTLAVDNLPCSLLHIFSQSPPTSGKPDTDRCTPPLALHHMPNPRLLCQPIRLVSDAESSQNVSSINNYNDSKLELNVKSETLPSDGKSVNHRTPNSCSELPATGPIIDSETGEVLLPRGIGSPVHSQNIESTVTENDKLHITFTINPSTTISIPKIIRRITELLGVSEDSVGYQITRSGAQITLDQKQPQSEVDMQTLETHLRQQFTPLSLRLEKEHVQRYSPLESQNASDFNHCTTLAAASPQYTFTNKCNTVLSKNEHSFPVTEICKYPEEPISLISLMANRSRSSKVCKQCDKVVSPHVAQRKWLDELVNISGVTMRAEIAQDFIFCSTDCLVSYSRFLSSNRCKIPESPIDCRSQAIDNAHNQISDANRQLVLLDLPCSVPVLLHNSSKSKPNNLKRQSSVQSSGPLNKRRTTQPPLTLSKYKWRGIKWRSYSSETNPLSLSSSRVSDEFSTTHSESVRKQYSHLEDKRICTLCSRISDTAEDGQGRLLPLDLDRWIHINCALWCYEVYETVGGSLNNIDLWLDKALATTCSHCGTNGAGLPCYNPKCMSIYHVPCALEVGCMFFTDRGMYCPQHQLKEIHPMRLSTLTANRRVYISRDENDQVARVVHEDDRNHVVRIGSVCLHSVGQLLPHQIDSGHFHTRRNIYPVGLCTTRIYWSSRRPKCRASYVCEILERDCRPFFRITAIDEELPNEIYAHANCNDVWQMILSKIDALRREHKLVRLFPQHLRGEDLYGLSEPHIVRAIESLPGVDGLRDYVFNFGRLELIAEMPLAVNPSGCARSEPKMQTYVKRSRIDSSENILPSLHRPGSLPGIRRLSHPGLATGHFASDASVSKQQQSSRSQQYRRLKGEADSNVILGRSRIQGFGLFAARDLEQQTMVIEYIGELIRVELANKREKEYKAHNRGIYMFRLDDDMVIDATVCGALARYINHSCEPNCYAECISFSDQAHIVIITNRRIKKGEELCYDYNFDLDDGGDKIPCLCGAPNCRKWMN